MEEVYAEVEKPIWTGPCIGGPMNGQDGASRCPKGFLLVDRPARLVWIYDWLPGDRSFLVRTEDGSPLVEDRDAADNRWRAAEEADFDIRALERGDE